jgi:hypothetical protein
VTPAGFLIGRNAGGDRDQACQLPTEATAMDRRIGVANPVEMAKELLGAL